MVRLVYSNRTEELLTALVADTANARRKAGPFEPLHLVVPNRNVETYVRFGLARESGIAANLRVHLLRRFVAGLVSGADKVRLVDGEALEGLVLAALLDSDLLQKPVFSPVRAYLHAAGDDGDAVDLRRCQLAAQLAHLFEEYAYARPDLLETWPLRQTLVEGTYAETEAWQRALWLALFGENGLCARRSRRDGVEWLSLGQLVARVPPSQWQLPGRVFLFGISYVARFFQQIFAAVGRQSDLHLYTLNPCREFWEDVTDDRGLRRPPRQGLQVLDEMDPFALESGGDTPALRLWGRPGRENIRLLNELTDCDFVDHFPSDEREPDSLLERLQVDILQRAPERPAPPDEHERIAADGSVQVLACPSIRREAEVIAEEIWRLVREDEPRARAEGRPPLRFNEIAVIVNARDRDAYYTHLGAAFHEAHALPHNMVDVPFAQASRMAEAVGLLLQLPFGRFGRQELLRLVTHPAVTARFEDVDAAQWLRWCDELGIVHGADRMDHAESYIDGDVLNWDQGMRRLALGTVMTGERSGRKEPFVLQNQPYLPHESGGEETSAARLGLLVRSLVADARFAKDAKLTLSDWAVFLRAWAESAFGPPHEDDERDYARCLNVLQSVGELDLDGREVSYRVACELALGRLGDLPGGKGQHLADGVVVSTCQPMRAIPFRVIFLAGMGEGKFPSADRKNQLDLRWAKRRAGDVSAREQDRYMFLETLLCARERLYLSYVSREELTGEPLEPSSVVVELREMLERAYLGIGGGKALVHEHRLRRSDPAYFPGIDASTALPEAREEARARALREHLQTAAGNGATPDLQTLKTLLPPERWERLRERLALPPVVTAIAPEEDTPLRVPIAALRRFLECPLQGHARFVLGLSDDAEEDVLALEDEPFSTARPEASGFLSRVVQEAIAEPGRIKSTEEFYQKSLLLRRLSAQAPLGLFGEIEQQAHRTTLRTWSRLFTEQVAGGSATSARPMRFGPAGENAQVDVLRDPLLLEVPVCRPDGSGRMRRIELYGRTELVVQPAGGAVFFEERRPDKKWAEQARRLRRALRAFVDHAVLSAAGLSTGRHDTFVCIANAGEGQIAHLPMAPLDPARAKAFLTALASELLSSTHSYLLPCEAIFKARVEGRDDVEACVPEAIRDMSVTSTYGPVPHPDRFPVPAAADARAIVERRFGLFFELLDSAEGAR